MILCYMFSFTTSAEQRQKEMQFFKDCLAICRTLEPPSRNRGIKKSGSAEISLIRTDR